MKRWRTRYYFWSWFTFETSSYSSVHAGIIAVGNASDKNASFQAFEEVISVFLIFVKRGIKPV